MYVRVVLHNHFPVFNSSGKRKLRQQTKSRKSSPGKGSPCSITNEHRVPELIPVLGSQPAGDVNRNPAVGCHYFPPGLQLLSQPRSVHFVRCEEAFKISSGFPVRVGWTRAVPGLVGRVWRAMGNWKGVQGRARVGPRQEVELAGHSTALSLWRGPTS